MNLKHSVAFERIRPNKVLNAAKWLFENRELFRNEGIQINNNWFKTIQKKNHRKEFVLKRVVSKLKLLAWKLMLLKIGQKNMLMTEQQETQTMLCSLKTLENLMKF